jgi:hypothetical protein
VPLFAPVFARGREDAGSGGRTLQRHRATILGIVSTQVNRRRYSPLRGRRLTAYEQWVERIAASRAGGWAFVHVFSPIDSRASGATPTGRAAASPTAGRPTARPAPTMKSRRLEVMAQSRPLGRPASTAHAATATDWAVWFS